MIGYTQPFGTQPFDMAGSSWASSSSSFSSSTSFTTSTVDVGSTATETRTGAINGEASGFASLYISRNSGGVTEMYFEAFMSVGFSGGGTTAAAASADSNGNGEGGFTSTITVSYSRAANSSRSNVTDADGAWNNVNGGGATEVWTGASGQTQSGSNADTLGNSTSGSFSEAGPFTYVSTTNVFTGTNTFSGGNPTVTHIGQTTQVETFERATTTGTSVNTSTSEAYDSDGFMTGVDTVPILSTFLTSTTYSTTLKTMNTAGETTTISTTRPTIAEETVQYSVMMSTDTTDAGTFVVTAAGGSFTMSRGALVTQFIVDAEPGEMLFTFGTVGVARVTDLGGSATRFTWTRGPGDTYQVVLPVVATSVSTTSQARTAPAYGFTSLVQSGSTATSTITTSTGGKSIVPESSRTTSFAGVASASQNSTSGTTASLGMTGRATQQESYFLFTDSVTEYAALVVGGSLRTFNISGIRNTTSTRNAVLDVVQSGSTTTTSSGTSPGGASGYTANTLFEGGRTVVNLSALQPVWSLKTNDLAATVAGAQTFPRAAVAPVQTDTEDAGVMITAGQSAIYPASQWSDWGVLGRRAPIPYWTAKTTVASGSTIRYQIDSLGKLVVSKKTNSSQTDWDVQSIQLTTAVATTTRNTQLGFQQNIAMVPKGYTAALEPGVYARNSRGASTLSFLTVSSLTMSTMANDSILQPFAGGITVESSMGPAVSRNEHTYFSTRQANFPGYIGG